jgi:hypothetical protein
MSAFDRRALTIDAQAGRGAFDGLSRLLVTISSYISALASVDVSPVSVHGSAIDPFYKLPGLRATILTAREHSAAWAPIGQTIGMNLLIGMTTFGIDLQGATREIKGIVEGAAAAKRPITAAERTRIVDLLRSLEGKLANYSSELSLQKPRVVDFVRLIATDSAPLQSGRDDLGAAITFVEQATAAEALKYLRPESQGIYQMIVELGAKIRRRLVDLKDKAGPLAQANQDSQRSIQGMLTIWETIKEKFSSVISVLADTRTSIDTFSDLPLMLELATESWKDLSDYVSH